MRGYNHPGTTELAKCSWAGTQTISSLDLVRKIDLINVLSTWLAKQELPVRRSGPVRKLIDTPEADRLCSARTGMGGPGGTSYVSTSPAGPFVTA